MAAIPGLSLCSDDYGNCRTLSDFERCATIAEGTFGVFYKVKEKRTGDIYCLKKYKMPADLTDGIPSTILREINILNSLKHVNLINSYGTVAGKSLLNNYILLDYCAWSLKDLVSRNVEAIYDKAMVKFFMQQLLYGLEYIHGGLIIHRDICSKNIIFTEQGILKISGFQASRFYAKGNMTPSVTELDYRAPELLFQAKMYGPAVDMWSAGCIFAQLLLKRPLFQGSSELEMLRSIFGVLGSPSEIIWPGLRDLLSRMEVMEEGGLDLQSEQAFSVLPRLLAEVCTSACKELIMDLLVYYPIARLSAQECLKSLYFTEIPHASKPEDMALIVRSLNCVVGHSSTAEPSGANATT